MGAYARMEHHREPTLTLLINSIRGGLTGARDRVAARGARRISTEVFIGEPAAEILASVSAGQADLIVMGGRGHGPLTGLLLGGVAQKVVALACCPVIVVHSILCPGAFPSRPTTLRQTVRLDLCEHREPWQPPGA